MKITVLVENHTKCELKAKHGLSLYIETKKHKILFDLGSDDTLFENAKIRGIDLSKVDTVIVSHGHIDHGGAINRFLQINSTAKIFVQRKAFEPHYSKIFFMKINVGIDSKLETHPQIILINGDYQIDEELNLFTVSQTDKCYSTVNDTLYDRDGKDKFSHEQSLIITENQTALIMGCGHAGIVNIMNKANIYQPLICVGGYHLINPITKKTVSTTLLNAIVQELQIYTQTRFYTCHCTGIEAFQYLSQQIPNMFYLSCGQEIEV
ncbi:MBL fold metallo-hydrolase [Anaerovorax sp. IOR16]|uniref:MBL fold metallo-hydrolase n=1 Tax=Anaerovorax sp. IOR16 TaxID=2773458 RepID=UPI0019CF52FD|nr:MBL fold metallo-hydrolase [Anaerovorax sp. IOR16]